MDSLLTVTTPATVFDLSVLADVKDDLAIAVSTYDATLLRYLSEASLAIAKACGRVFAQEAVSEQFRFEARPQPMLILTRWPVSAVASIVEDSTTLIGADWEVDAVTGRLYRLRADYKSWWTASKITVAYTAGYNLAANGAPKDLQAAARSLIKSRWFAKARDPLVKSEEVPGVLRQDYWVGGLPGEGGFPPDVEDIVSLYRSPLA